ncbi:MAG: hypothetical protein IT371_30485 [Deltaproteobacteria bacterium]|nr:hypothetical protein [Deltaproteobacteria bacterium]
MGEDEDVGTETAVDEVEAGVDEDAGDADNDAEGGALLYSVTLKEGQQILVLDVRDAPDMIADFHRDANEPFFTFTGDNGLGAATVRTDQVVSIAVALSPDDVAAYMGEGPEDEDEVEPEKPWQRVQRMAEEREAAKRAAKAEKRAQAAGGHGNPGGPKKGLKGLAP